MSRPAVPAQRPRRRPRTGGFSGLSGSPFSTEPARSVRHGGNSLTRRQSGSRRRPGLGRPASSSSFSFRNGGSTRPYPVSDGQGVSAPLHEQPSPRKEHSSAFAPNATGSQQSDARAGFALGNRRRPSVDSHLNNDNKCTKQADREREQRCGRP